MVLSTRLEYSNSLFQGCRFAAKSVPKSKSQDCSSPPEGEEPPSSVTSKLGEPTCEIHESKREDLSQSNLGRSVGKKHCTQVDSPRTRNYLGSITSQRGRGPAEIERADEWSRQLRVQTENEALHSVRIHLGQLSIVPPPPNSQHIRNPDQILGPSQRIAAESCKGLWYRLSDIRQGELRFSANRDGSAPALVPALHSTGSGYYS